MKFKIIVFTLLAMIISMTAFAQTEYTKRTKTALMDSLKSGVRGNISASNLRDAIGSAFDAAGDSARALGSSMSAFKDSMAVVDSSYIVNSKLSVDDINQLGIRLSAKMPLTSYTDSSKSRQQNDFYLNYMDATADSIASNDSLNVEVTYVNPIGSKQVAFFHNLTGLSQKVQLRWSFKMPNVLATLDSIVVPVWTETKAGTINYGMMYVYEDSLETKFSDTIKATGDTLYSNVTARVTANRSVKPNYIPGIKEVLLKMTVVQTVDSLFIGRPRVYLTNR